MKTVAIIAASFAPSNHPPAIRTRFLATHLREFGWRPVVITVRPELLGEAQDPAFLELLPPDLDIVRTGAIKTRVSRLLGIGDLGLRSFPYHARALRSLCATGGVDAVLIPGPPWYAFRLGPLARRRHHVPYVLDYIDPWVQSLEGDARWPSKAWLAHRVATILEPSAVRQAAAIVTVAEGISEAVRSRYPDVPPDRFTVIPYGFEASDFGAVQTASEHEWAGSYPGALNVCHVGAVPPPAVDTLRALLRALARVRATHPAGAALRLHFLGTGYGFNPRPIVSAIAVEERVADAVREQPVRLPYSDAVRAMRSADMLLALGGPHSHYLASKIFPSLLAGRPLLAIFHAASGVCPIVRDAGGRLVTFDGQVPAMEHVNEIADAFSDLLDGRAAPPPLERVQDLATRYSARAMAQRLADVLDRVVALPGAPSSGETAA